MHQPQPLEFHNFRGTNALDDLIQSSQVEYMRVYLSDLDAKKLIVEPNYFDRDYLSEFSTFYSRSARGYKNICKRIHFFNDENVTRELFEKAASGDDEAVNTLNSAYLGFCVIRPISQTPLGKTVLRWYTNRHKDSRRIVDKRKYTCHVAGVNLTVKGLAWQQQDTGVGACATIALWSALHSLAFDDYHAIPTTAQITKAAHLTASLGERVFPTNGLTIQQLREAIKELGLSPAVQSGELPGQLFSKERFMSSVASYIRSGYPVIAIGRLGDAGLHAVCLVGFREPNSTSLQPNYVTLQDSHSDVIYLHDDNLGPNVRCEINIEKQKTSCMSSFEYVSFKPKAPEMKYSENPRPTDPTSTYPKFTPISLVVAVHNDLRTSPETLYRTGLSAAAKFCEAINLLMSQAKQPPLGISLSTRFIKLTDYIHGELGRLLGKNPTGLSNVRLRLWEDVCPMSLHLGLVRIGSDSTPILDIIYDTTDSDRNHPIFAHVAFNPLGETIARILSQHGVFDFGPCVKAF